MSDNREISTEELLALNNARQMPHNDEAERGILSCLLQMPDLISECRLKLSTDGFYHPPRRMVYEAILALEAAGKPVDFVLLTNALREAGNLEKAGGAAELSDIFTFIPTPSHFPHYLGILLRALTARTAMRIGAEIIAVASGHSSAISGPLDRSGIACEVDRLAQTIHASTGGPEELSMNDLVGSALEYVEEQMRNPGLPGISTGLGQLDDRTGGIVPGECWVLAGGTSDGKTALAMQIMLQMALLGHPVAHYLGESSKNKWTLRLLACLSGVALRNILRGTMSPEDMGKVHGATKKLVELPIHLRYCPGAEHTWICSDARQLKRRHGLKMWIVDYVQKFRNSRCRNGREQEVAQMSRDFTATACDCGAAVLMLSQLNRQRQLRESDSITHDADVILTLSVPEDTDKDGNVTRHENQRFITIGKARNEERGSHLEFNFNGSVQRFTE